MTALVATALLIAAVAYSAWVFRTFVVALRRAGDRMSPPAVRRLPTASIRITAVVREVDEDSRVLVLTRADGARHRGLVFTLEGAPERVESAATLLQQWRDDDSSVLLVASRGLPER